jgi:hypothetical protein
MKVVGGWSFYRSYQLQSYRRSSQRFFAAQTKKPFYQWLRDLRSQLCFQVQRW